MPIPAERDQGFRPLDLLTKEFRLPKPHAEAEDGAVRWARSEVVLEHANQLMIELGPVNFYPFDTKYAPDGVFDPGEYALSTQINTDQGTIHVDVTATYADVPSVKSLGQITGVTLNFRMGEGESSQALSLSVPRIDLKDPDVALDEEQQEKEEEELAARAQKELPSVADLEKAMHLLFSVVPDALLASGAISNKDNPKVPQGKPTSLLGETPTQVEVLSPAELGERIYDAMTGLTTNLLATPEFTDALGRAFFHRQIFPHGSKNEINSVYFLKAGFGYLVEWHSTRFEPRSHSFQERTDLIRSSLRITRYDPNQSTDGWRKKVASMEAECDFLEDEDGGILRFTEGSALLSEEYVLGSSWETPPSWRSAKPITHENVDALDKTPGTFKDLYPIPVKI